MAMELVDTQPQSGVSLIEVLIAQLVALVALLGILPLFFGGIRDNLQARELAAVSNYARSELESKLAFGASHWTMQLQNGVESLSTESLGIGTRAIGDEHWGGAGLQRYARETRVGLYSLGTVQDVSGNGVVDQISGIGDDDNDGILDSPLLAGSSPNLVHLRMLDVLVDNVRTSGPLGSSRDLEVRLFIGF